MLEKSALAEAPAQGAQRGPHTGPGAGQQTIPCGSIQLTQLDLFHDPSLVPQISKIDTTCSHFTEITDPGWQADVVSAIKAAAGAMVIAPCTAAALTSAISGGSQAHLVPGWSVSGYACDSGYALANINVPHGLSLVAVLKQQGTSWTVIYGPTEGLCIEPIDLQFCPNHQLPLPKSVLQILTAQLRSQIASTPAFYVSTGYDPGTLYSYPGYPTLIGLNNVDSISGLTWDVSATGATGTGTMNLNNCKPDCASGSGTQYPVHILLSGPQLCRVKVFDPSSSTFTRVSAYVFGKATVVSLSGKPPASYVGSSVFSVTCG